MSSDDSEYIQSTLLRYEERKRMHDALRRREKLAPRIQRRTGHSVSTWLYVALLMSVIVWLCFR